MRHLTFGAAMLGAALAAVVGAGDAQAQAQRLVFSQQEGHWTIYNIDRRCYAVNRPLSEFNAAPFNALILALARGGPLTMSVHFWPGQFRETSPHRLILRPGSRSAITVPARATSDFALETSEALSPGFVQDLRTSDTLTVAAEGVSQSLVFDTLRIGFVIARLENCAQLL